eukprot:COSAG02_NODE_50990_length_317_cov_0.697248_2_plen_57_part_01
MEQNKQLNVITISWRRVHYTCCKARELKLFKSFDLSQTERPVKVSYSGEPIGFIQLE